MSALAGFEVRVLGDVEVGGYVSVLQVDASLADDAWPADEDVARAAGVARVRFSDAGDHPHCRESIYRIVEVA